MQKFKLIIKPYSLNEYRNAHYYTLSNLKKSIGEDVHWQLMAQKIQKVNTPITITYVFHFANKRRHDLDNYVATAKFINDVLTPMQMGKKGKNYGVGIIPDDSVEYINKMVFVAGEDKEEGVDLIIE